MPIGLWTHYDRLPKSYISPQDQDLFNFGSEKSHIGITLACRRGYSGAHQDASVLMRARITTPTSYNTAQASEQWLMLCRWADVTLRWLSYTPVHTDSPQDVSSLPSEQSMSPSHCHTFGIHRPFPHWYWDCSHSVWEPVRKEAASMASAHYSQSCNNLMFMESSKFSPISSCVHKKTSCIDRGVQYWWEYIFWEC